MAKKEYSYRGKTLQELQEMSENEFTLSTPVVVLLQGTNAEQGKKLLENKSPNIIPVDNLTDGAKQAIALAASA